MSPQSGGPKPPLRIELSVSREDGEWPEPDAVERLASQALRAIVDTLALRSATPTELGILLTSDSRIQALNRQWRGKDKPTNVLSFPAFPQHGRDGIPPMLGDIVLAAETVRREADLEGKPFDHHLTHLIVHGALHLLGYDHEVDDEADEMESVERRVLAALAIADPYALTDEHRTRTRR